MLRARGAPTPCWRCPKESPGSGRELSAKNRLAYELYLKIKAGAPMPADPIVQRNCALCRWVEDAVGRSQFNINALFGLILRMKGNG